MVHVYILVVVNILLVLWCFIGRDPIDEMRKILDDLSTERSGGCSGEGI